MATLPPGLVSIHGDTPMPALHRAAECRDIVLLRNLLAAGADPHERHEFHATPLICACRGNVTVGAGEALERYLAAPLPAPAIMDRPACVRALLDAGADPNDPNGYGHVALNCCARLGELRLLKMLLAAGADPDGRAKLAHFQANPMVASYMRSGQTVLHTAVDTELGQYHECVAALLAAGASVNAVATRILMGNIQFTAIEYLLVRSNRTELSPRRRRLYPLLLKAGATLPTAAAQPPQKYQNVLKDPYLRAVMAAGGFKKYAERHLATIAALFARTERLPPEMVRHVFSFWLHAGYYVY